MGLAIGTHETGDCTRKTAVASHRIIQRQSGRPKCREGPPMRSLHVAVLDEELPFPLTSGKRIRTYNLLARLATRHRITLLCHRNPDPDEADAAERAFRDLGIETAVVDRAVP